MKLEKLPVNDKITTLCQTKCYVPQTSYQWLQTTKMNFEKLLGEQVKNHNYNPFQSSSSLSVPASLFIFCVIYTLILQTFPAVFLNDSLNLVAISTVLILILDCERNERREGREGGFPSLFPRAPSRFSRA